MDSFIIHLILYDCEVEINKIRSLYFKCAQLGVLKDKCSEKPCLRLIVTPFGKTTSFLFGGMM